MRLPLLCRNSRAVALAEPGLMADWLAGWQNAGKFQILTFAVDWIFELFAVFDTVTALLEQYMDVFKFVFSAKACFKVVVRSVKTGEAIVFLVNPFY